MEELRVIWEAPGAEGCVVGFLEGTYYIKGENENLALSV